MSQCGSCQFGCALNCTVQGARPITERASRSLSAVAWRIYGIPLAALFLSTSVASWLGLSAAQSLWFCVVGVALGMLIVVWWGKRLEAQLDHEVRNLNADSASFE